MIYQSHEWTTLMAAHEQRAQDRLDTFRHPGEYHPVYDFLFEYYPVRPSHLKRWHPGVGVSLAGNPPHATWRDYHPGAHGVSVDVPAWWSRRGDSARHIREILRHSATTVSAFDCFGLHEWAMVYKADKPRHDLPLRLGAAGTNEVVENNRIKCTHYDAYRFFTEPAIPLNFSVLTREDQKNTEQAGCVHATMDLYKWAWKLGPLVPGDLLLDALDLAIKARTLDMEASPYDCRGLGFGVVPIETPQGKAEYVARQRELARLGQPLRERLIGVIDRSENDAHR